VKKEKKVFKAEIEAENVVKKELEKRKIVSSKVLVMSEMD
jgi:hypothetical protein